MSVPAASHKFTVTPGPTCMWRERGFDDGMAGKEPRQDVPEDHRAAYWAGYRGARKKKLGAA